MAFAVNHQVFGAGETIRLGTRKMLLVTMAFALAQTPAALSAGRSPRWVEFAAPATPPAVAPLACQGADIASYFEWQTRTVQESTVLFVVPASFASDRDSDRLLAPPVFPVPDNLYYRSIREERYASALLEIAMLAHYKPAQAAALRRLALEQQSDVIAGTALHRWLLDNIDLSIGPNDTVAALTSRFKSVASLGRSVSEILGLLEELGEILAEFPPTVAPPRDGILADPRFAAVINARNIRSENWKKAWEFYQPLSRAAKMVSATDAVWSTLGTSGEILVNWYLTRLMAGDDALTRLQDMKSQLQAVALLGGDPALSTAFTNAEGSLLELQSEDSARLLAREFLGRWRELTQNAIAVSAAAGLTSQKLVTNVAAKLAARGIVVQSSVLGPVAVLIAGSVQAVNLYLGIQLQHRAAQLAVIAGTLGRALCERSQTVQSLRVPAMYAYVIAARYTIEAFDWDPLPGWGFTDAVREWENAYAQFSSRLDEEWNLARTGPANSLPSLTSVRARPAGTGTGRVTFEVMYVDEDNDRPSYLNLYVDSMAPTDIAAGITHGPPSEGVLYAHLHSASFAVGQHRFWFETSDGHGLRSTTPQTFEITHDSSAVSSMEVNLSPVTATVFQPMTASALARNQIGNPLPNAIVNFSATLSGFFSSPSGVVPGRPLSARTNAAGLATIVFTPNVSGTGTFVAAAENAQTVSSPLVVNGPNLAIDVSIRFKSGTDTLTTYEAMASTTQNGNPVANQQVCFSSDDAVVVIPVPCVFASSQGRAQTDFTVSAGGSRVLCATVAGQRACTLARVSVGPVPVLTPAESLTMPAQGGLAWSADGFTLFGGQDSAPSGSPGGAQRLQRLDVRDLNVSWSGPLSGGRQVHSVVANVSGSKIAVGQSAAQLSVVDAATGTVDFLVDIGTGQIWSVDWLGSNVISAQNNGSVCSYSSTGSRNWCVVPTSNDMRAIGCNGINRCVAGDQQGNLYVVESNGAVTPGPTNIGGGQEIWDIAWSPSNSRIAVVGDGFARLYNMSGSSIATSGMIDLAGHDHGSDVFAVEYISDGTTKIVTGAADGTIQIFSENGNREAQAILGDVRRLAWSASRRVLAVGDNGTTVHLINFGNDETPPAITLGPRLTRVAFETTQINLTAELRDTSSLRPTAKVTVNGTTNVANIPFGQSSATIAIVVPLNVGSNAVGIEVRDAFGNLADSTLVIERDDDVTGPDIMDVDVSPRVGLPGGMFTIAARARDQSLISQVTASIQNSAESVLATVVLADDGHGPDTAAGDGLFSGLWMAPPDQEARFLVDIASADTHAPPNVSAADDAAAFETAVARLLVIPTQIAFPAVEVGQTGELAVSVLNGGGGSIVGVASADPPFSIIGNASFEVPAGETRIVRVGFQPSQVGRATGKVRVVSAAGNIERSAQGDGEIRHTLSVARQGSGVGSVVSNPGPVDCGDICTSRLVSGLSVILTPTAGQGSVFAGWGGDADCRDGELVMSGDRQCTVVFAKSGGTRRRLTISTSGAGAGVISSIPAGIVCGVDCEESFEDGTLVTLIAAPSSGSSVAALSGDQDCEDGTLTLAADRHCSIKWSVAFSDDPLSAGVTIKAVQFIELRRRIDSLRVRHRLQPFPWTDDQLGSSTRVRAVHVLEMRTAIGEAYQAAGQPPPSFTDPTLAQGTTIKAVHILELRRAVVALE